MKRKVIAGILIMTTLALTACGSQEGSTNTGNNTEVNSQVQADSQEQTGLGDNGEEDKAETSKVEISMEALRNHAETPASDFECMSDGEGVKIIDYLGSDEIVVIPEEIEGKKVLHINDHVFGMDSSVKAIRLSDSLEGIAASFMRNENLQYVICGNSLKLIGMNAFNGCTSLKEIELNEGLEELGDAAFNKCTSLMEIYVPNSVNAITDISFAMMSEGFTIKAKVGSKAEEVANAKGYIFEAVE